MSTKPVLEAIYIEWTEKNVARTDSLKYYYLNSFELGSVATLDLQFSTNVCL